MPKVTIQPPKDAGAVRIGVFAPDGQVLKLPQLVLPPAGTFEFDAPQVGTYTASLESIGTEQLLWSFPVAPDTARLEAPSLDTLRRQGTLGSARHGAEIASDFAAVELWTGDHLEIFPNLFQTNAVASERQIDARNISRASTINFDPGLAAGLNYSLGLSYDSQPQRAGGWRPFTGSNVSTRRTSSGDVEVEFDRDGKLPPANSGARLRLSFAIEANRVQRVLVPLFAGGVKVKVRTSEAPYLSGDTLSIIPSRPETHALLQALTSTSIEIATRIWEEIGRGPHQLARYASADLEDDPWVSVAVGVLMLRLGWFQPNDYWVAMLAEIHPWLSDASILAAYHRLAQTPPDVSGAIKHLRQARRGGAVYFFEANRLQGDMLVALAADSPQDNDRQIAAAELALWRGNLAHQVQVGPFFSWLMARGALTSGSLDQRDSNILDAGRLTGVPSWVATLSSLTVFEEAELAKRLEAKLGVTAITPTTTTALVAGSAPSQEKTEFTVILASVGDKKIEVIKEVRAITGLSLKEAKDLVEGAPRPVKEGIDANEAKRLKAQIESVGAKVEVK